MLINNKKGVNKMDDNKFDIKDEKEEGKVPIFRIHDEYHDLSPMDKLPVLCDLKIWAENELRKTLIKLGVPHEKTWSAT